MMNAIGGNLYPQWRQMVASFLVAVYSAVHSYKRGENYLTPRAFEILTDTVEHEP